MVRIFYKPLVAKPQVEHFVYKMRFKNVFFHQMHFGKTILRGCAFCLAKNIAVLRTFCEASNRPQGACVRREIKTKRKKRGFLFRR